MPAVWDLTLASRVFTHPTCDYFINTCSRLLCICFLATRLCVFMLYWVFPYNPLAPGLLTSSSIWLVFGKWLLSFNLVKTHDGQFEKSHDGQCSYLLRKWAGFNSENWRNSFFRHSQLFPPTLHHENDLRTIFFKQGRKVIRFWEERALLPRRFHE